MGPSISKCCTTDPNTDPTSAGPGGRKKLFFLSSLFQAKQTSPGMPKAEKAIKAALLIQRWYRRYCARLEVRRRYTWSIFQSIEYAGEQDQMKLHNFFNALLSHVGNGGASPEFMEAISPTSSPTHAKAGGTRRKLSVDKIQLEDIPVEYNYRGSHVSFPITTEVVHKLIDSFKNKKALHAKYVCLILRETAKELKSLPTVTFASTAISNQITIIGDLHGKLDDLLTILYKNGLPSTDNPYVLNGDFVDRGKNSIEVLVLLCALFLAFPSQVHLNRGNHEDMIMNARYGFCKEVNRKYKDFGPRILRYLEELYRWLPLATVIDKKVLVVHGGISDSTDINKMAEVNRGKYISILRMPEDQSNKRSADAPDGSAVNEVDDSMIQLPSEESHVEWQQVLDILWSDPQAAYGCSPNEFRGGGTYFGPDITKSVLDLHGYKLLIRSHECKIEGYEFMHDNQCLTIFSASNYYETGSNKGAYVKLQGPDLEPHFIQYMADTKQKQMTFRQRVGRMEGSAIKELKAQLMSSKLAIVEKFKERDSDNSGFISVSDWVSIMEENSHLKLPWRVLKERLVVSNSSGEVDYMSTFNYESLMRKAPKQGGPTVIEALYKHKHSLETIFRLMDKDNSGFISMEEFEETCKLIGSHMDDKIPQQEILDMARSIDINKDGKIDFNEFLECFRIVDSQSARNSARNKDDGEYGIIDEDDDLSDIYYQ